MISRFFIDRPIFAAVLSIFITLTGGIALLSLPIAQYPPVTPPGVAVSIFYPGANAQVVADTVAAPIEQQVNGVEGMLYMSSQMGNDGSYMLTVTFDIGTDLNTALVMVQNRVQLAMPLLPTSVQNQGITIRKKTPDILNIISFYSPDGRYDDVYLSNYATIHVLDELLRIDGVSQINYQGVGNYSIRVWLDPQKLASLNMTVLDVANAIRNQNLDAPAGMLGQQPSTRTQPFELPIDTLGRLTTTEQFGDLIVKADQGQPPPPPSAPLTPSTGTHSLPNPRHHRPPRHRGSQQRHGRHHGNGGHDARHGQDLRERHDHRADQQRDDRHDRDGNKLGRGDDDRGRPEHRRRHNWRRGHRHCDGRGFDQPGEWSVDPRYDARLCRQRRTQRHDDGPRAGSAGGRHRAAARRGPRRTGGAELQPRRHLRRPPGRGPRHLSVARHQRAGRRWPDPGQDGGAQGGLPGGG